MKPCLPSLKIHGTSKVISRFLLLTKVSSFLSSLLLRITNVPGREALGSFWETIHSAKVDAIICSGKGGVSFNTFVDQDHELPPILLDT
ncbi:hypothetical protein MA16_Dca007830 [Dendrobium catenatum]|uniref:Uncharacterized protein n=1 Tax=Dendrobium catenatum TaxID=906689 RepID=A0A2I0X5J2_9ASPA|nr:hypothetical protein MA16_Dca007830 [Dendrobium catenatum]